MFVNFLILTNAASLIDLGDLDGSPSTITAESERLNQQISLYNKSFDQDLVKPTDLWNVTQFFIPENVGKIFIDLNLSGVEGYVMLKWGNTDRFYYVKDWIQSGTHLPNIEYIPTIDYIGNGWYRFKSDVFGGDLFRETGNFLKFNYISVPEGLDHYTIFTVPEPSYFIVTFLCFGIVGINLYKRLRFKS